MESSEDQLRRLTAKINAVWEQHYGGGPVTEIKQLENRVHLLGEDLDCWKFNARVCNKEMLRLNGQSSSTK